MAMMNPGAGFLSSNFFFKNQMKVTSSPVLTSYCKNFVTACGLETQKEAGGKEVACQETTASNEHLEPEKRRNPGLS